MFKHHIHLWIQLPPPPGNGEHRHAKSNVMQRKPTSYGIFGIHPDCGSLDSSIVSLWSTYTSLHGIYTKCKNATINITNQWMYIIWIYLISYSKSGNFGATFMFALVELNLSSAKINAPQKIMCLYTAILKFAQKSKCAK